MWPQRTNMSNQVLSETWICWGVRVEVETLQTQLTEFANKPEQGEFSVSDMGLP